MKSIIHYFTAFLAILCALALPGCSPSNKGNPTSWAAIQLTGKSLELIDSEQVEFYRFLRDGGVAATAGIQNGPLIAPVLYWKIDNNNLLIAEDPRFETSESFSAPFIQGDVVTVKRGLFRWSQFKLVP
ncbi:MAG: hypothetical protein WC736_13530 [Gallionella sp.]|jgi:hypothetical protein